MSGTQAQNVSSVAVDIALSMSAWLTAAVAEVPPPLPPPHAASAALNDAAPAEASKVRRLIGNCRDDVAMVNSRQRAGGTGAPGNGVLGTGGIETGARARGVLSPLVSDGRCGPRVTCRRRWTDRC